MTTERTDSIRTLTGIVSALCLIVLVPLNTWALLRLVDHGERIVAIESFIRNESQVDMLISDIKDHEKRIRTLEQK